MPSLSSSIVNQKVASVRDVEEALSRQSLYGGDLMTNLLELAAVSEDRLRTVLAECYELEPAPIGELPVAPEPVRRVIAGDLAQRFALYPLEESEGTITLAVAEPLPAEVEQHLSSSLGARIVQRVALLVRVRQAIARDYGGDLDRRSLRVLSRLNGKSDPGPHSLPNAPGERVSPRPAASPSPARVSLATTGSALEATGSDRARVPRAPALPDLSSLARSEPASRPRRHGPFTIAMAERGLLEAESPDDVLHAFFDFAAQFFDYSALFAVQGDLAEGRDASGAGAPRSRLVAVGVPLDLPSAMSRARGSSTYELTRLSSSGLDGSLAKDLERRPGRLVLFLPVQVRGRTVLILYGDHGDQDVELGAIGEVISFAPLVSNAFERLILRKRSQEKGSDPATRPAPSRAREHATLLPNAGQRASKLASLIEDATLRGVSTSRPAAPLARHSQSPRPALVTSPTAHHSPPPMRAIPVTPVGASGARSAPQASISARPAPTKAIPEDGWDSATARGPFPELERGTKPGVGPAGRPHAAKPDAASETSTAPANEPRAPDDHDGSLAEASPEAPPSEPKSRSSALPRLQLVQSTVPPPLPSPDAAELLLSQTSTESDADERPPISTGVPLAPASRSVAYSARPLPMRDLSQDVGLPSVIVDLAIDTRELMERLLDGDSSAGEKLSQIGDTAITVLVSIFPGPITAELKRSSGDGPGKASECGPVLRTLARMGTRPVPFVAVRTADSDPAIRAWATRLLGEMPSSESAQAVARRLTDDDPDVQRAALAAGHMLLHHAEASEALQAKIAETVSDATRPENIRHTLIESLAELRAALVVPTLIRLLEDGSPDIVRSAHWALGVIARQDFGTKAALWEDWWLANSERHRIEWLIDALMHDDQDLRRTAGDELKSLTKEYFGYYDDLPQKERERAQERYRKWWDTKGKARFRW